MTSTFDPSKMPDHLRDILLFEMAYRLRAGQPKHVQVRDRFGLSSYTYRRLLKLALAHPESRRLAPGAVARTAGAHPGGEPRPAVNGSPL